MNRIILLLSVFMFVLPAVGHAREDVLTLSKEDALNSALAPKSLGSQVSFYFGNEKDAADLKVIAEIKTNKKTNAFKKDDKTACEWAFYSALIAFEKKAISLGGNAIVDIRSNYGNVEVSSDDSFRCGAGNVIAGVALTGKVVKLD